MVGLSFFQNFDKILEIFVKKCINSLKGDDFVRKKTKIILSISIGVVVLGVGLFFLLKKEPPKTLLTEETTTKSGDESSIENWFEENQGKKINKAPKIKEEKDENEEHLVIYEVNAKEDTNENPQYNFTYEIVKHTDINGYSYYETDYQKQKAISLLREDGKYDLKIKANAENNDVCEFSISNKEEAEKIKEKVLLYEADIYTITSFFDFDIKVGEKEIKINTISKNLTLLAAELPTAFEDLEQFKINISGMCQYKEISNPTK